MNTEEKILRILEEEIVPAEGCTEPIALAYTAAKTKEILNDDDIKEVIIRVSGNIIKNVKSVVVPNSGGMVGIEVSVVMGLIAGDSKKDLMVISDITDEDMKKVREFLDTKSIKVIHEDTDVKLYIKIELKSKKSSASVEVKHMHTNITKITKDGRVVLDRPCNDIDFNSPLTDRKVLSIKTIYEYAKKIDLEKIEPLFNKVIALNSQIAKEGLVGNYGVNIGKIIADNIELGIYGDDARNRAASFASAGSDARMSGCALPVMTTSGSGNQGMTSSLALIEYARIMKISHEELIRALFFSHLATIHIKTNVGRLSAYCGVICSSAAVAGALAFINKESFEVIAHSIINTLGDVSGIICDGAKSSCAMKISTTIYAAFDSYLLARVGKYLHGGDGIIASDIEETLKNIGKLSQDGMYTTDEVIIDIMSHKS
ncbi:serine dehydratase subunit alpha family protein [Sulfurospirillum sp. 1307]|jgi:L-cysteine desulfidase